MSGFDPNDFYSTPQDEILSFCPQSSGDTCCTREYSEEIGDLSDPFSTSFRAVIPHPITTCRDALQQISCIMCSPAQTDWIYVNADFSTLVMCETFCESVYDACSTQNTVNDTSVAETYAQERDFCLALFDDLSHSETPVKIIIDQHNRECWNNLPECTQDSFYRLYTECVNGRRNMIWVKKPEVQCAGGLDDPQNEHDLPCAATCPAGERTKEQGETGDGDCVTCPAGTYSLGSDILEDSWSSPDDLVLQFHSYCTWTDGYGVERVWTETECRWNLNYGQISSPTSLNDSMSAYLETSVTLLADGEFIFSAKSDSELNFDGLRIFVDRVVVSDIGLISHTKEFQTYRVPLQQGYHYIQLVYYKDISVSVGLDQATINMIEVTNVRYASDYCTPCAPGKHSSEPGQRTCTPCEFFTYSDTEGAVQCTPCPEGTYSLDGYTECLPRPPCEDDAMYYRYGPCFYDAEEDGPRRYATAHWVEPHICDQDQLPEDELVLCPPCEPGMYRDQNGVDCYFCEEGTYSVGDDSPCVSCEAGHEAVRNLVFDEFNDFYYGLSTSCQYDCNTAGWVLREDAVDSGTGHGTYVVSTLTFEQSFPEAGTIAFEYSLICIESCLLTFQSDTADINPYRSFGGGFTINPTNIRLQFEVPAGNHTFNWVFTRDDRVGDGTNDRAQINYISARNTAEGGAVDCTPCEPGYYNPNTNQVNCIAAAPGFYATGGTSYQTQCEGNTYTDKEGQHTCSECGENVQALPGNTGCDITCSLELDNLIFNLSPMARNDSEMYGPIWDSRNNTYYLNMCDKQHNGHTCFDISNQPLETYVCQVTDIGIGQDLGSTFGILPLREAYYPEYTVGVTVHLTNGSPCHNGTHYFNRQAYIDVICDPYAGVGSPASLFENVETEKCVYQFQWSSLYGCPVCQESDYHYIASECEDGVSTLTYEWNSNPKTCHGGVTLPEPQEVACTGSTYCGPGQYFDSVDGECEDAPRGFYSVGNGIRVSSWTELENGFTSNGWIQSEKFISSGIGETSLLYVQNFVREGTIEITFSVDNYGDSTARFRIYIDDVLEGNEIYSTNNEFITRTIHIPTGYHYIKFAFVAGTLTDTNTRGRGVKVKEMTILGFNWASSYPIPCPAGTFAAEPASTRCQDCGWNTHSYEASSHCMGCPTDEYAFPGSQDCSPRELCTLSDYNLIYTTCQDGEQQASYSLIEPSICKEEEPPTPIDETVECFPCEAGLYREAGTDDECKSCPIGKYWDAEKEKCKSAKPGNAALLEKSYFTSPLPGDHLPSEFTTGCDGDCFCSSANCENDGWRFRGSFVDSGIYENRQVDVFLDLTLDLINAGQISFNYEVLGQSSNGLEFFVNNKQIDIPYHASAQHQKSMSHVSIDIGEGPNVFRWNYHQEANTMGSVQLSSIIIEGIGGSTGETICPAGEYSEDSESSYCTPCPPGTANAEEGATGCNVCGENQFSIVEGSTECLECGSGTQANADRTDCETDCIFTFDGDVYDISYLQSTHGPFAIDDGETGVWMNVCKKRSSNSFCLDPYGNSIETYMCEVDTRGNGIDYGNFLSVDLVEVEGSPEKAVRLSYSVVGDDDDSSCHSTVTVICDPDSSIQVPFLIGNPSDCDLHMRWNSAHGCRVCTDDDYEEQESECDDGKQTINSVRKTNCFGPVIRSTTEESCPTRYSFSLAVIIVVVILVVVLIIIIVAAVAYNRRLHGQYVALVRDSEGQYEMENMDEDTTVSDDKEKEEEPKPDAEAV